MQGHDQKEQDNTKLNRRKFLTRAGAGLVIASLPAKSVWASEHCGVANSICASGHGSDFANGATMALLSPGYFHKESNLGSLASLDFQEMFGGPLFTNAANKSTATFLYILNNAGGGGEVKSNSGKVGGSSNVNRFMVNLVANAYYDGMKNIHYPILPSRRLNPPGIPTIEELKTFARGLYLSAESNGPDAMGDALSKMITDYHVSVLEIKL